MGISPVICSLAEEDELETWFESDCRGQAGDMAWVWLSRASWRHGLSPTVEDELETYLKSDCQGRAEDMAWVRLSWTSWRHGLSPAAVRNSLDVFHLSLLKAPFGEYISSIYLTDWNYRDVKTAANFWKSFKQLWNEFQSKALIRFQPFKIILSVDLTLTAV